MSIVLGVKIQIMGKTKGQKKTKKATDSRKKKNIIKDYQSKFEKMKAYIEQDKHIPSLKKRRGRPRKDKVNKVLSAVFEKNEWKKYIRLFLDDCEDLINEGNSESYNQKLYTLWVFLHGITGDLDKVDTFLQRFLNCDIMKKAYKETHLQINLKKEEKKVFENLKKFFVEMNKNKGCFNRKYMISFLGHDVSSGVVADVCAVDVSYVRKIRKAVNSGEIEKREFLRRYAPFLKRGKVKESEIQVFPSFLSAETFNRSGSPLERIQLQEDYQLYSAYCEFIDDHNFIQSKKDESFVPYPKRSYPVFSKLKKKFKVKKMKSWDMHFRCEYCHEMKMKVRENKKLKRELQVIEEKLKEKERLVWVNRKKEIESTIKENEKKILEITKTHVELDKNQRNYVKEKEKNLEKDELLIFQDYLTVNWSIYDMLLVVVSKEKKEDDKKFHYIHYVSPRYKENKEENKNDSHYTIDCWNDFMEIVKKKFPDVKKITIVSDGGPKHYKTGLVMYYYSTLEKKFGVKFEYIFLCPHHGANYCDTCFGRMKKVIHKYERTAGKDVTDVEKMVEVCEEDEELKKHDWCITFDVPKYTEVTMKSNVFPKGIRKYFGIYFLKVDGRISCEIRSGSGDLVVQDINIDDGNYVPEFESSVSGHSNEDRAIVNGIESVPEKEENIPKRKKKKLEKNDMEVSEELICFYCDETIDCDQENFMKCTKSRCGCSVHVDCTASRRSVQSFFVSFVKEAFQRMLEKRKNWNCKI